MFLKNSNPLRTFQLVRMFLTNLNYTLRIRRMAHIFPRTFADLPPLCYDNIIKF